MNLRPVIVTLSVLALTVTGCAREVTGVAVPDPAQPGVALTADGYGIVAGFAEAPVQLEIFTEPQCLYCADLQMQYGDQLKAGMQSGRLSVTYRPLTFLDDEYLTDYSSVASNSLFLAVDESTDAGTFQTYVANLWFEQDLSYFDYSDQDFADIAADSGLSDEVVQRIAAGEQGVDTTELLEVNFAALEDASTSLGTPVVYDLTHDELVDITDDGWLTTLLK